MSEHHYLSNRELLAEITRCQQVNVVSPKLCTMLMLLVERLALKPSYRNYSYLRDMQSEALVQLIKPNETGSDRRPNVLKFSTAYAIANKKTPNPFSYCTTIVLNAFKRFIKLEQALHDFRDDMLLEARMAPSAKRQAFNDANWSAEPIPKKPKPKPRPRKSDEQRREAAVLQEG